MSTAKDKGQFTALDLPSALQQQLLKQNYRQMTAIQQAALPYTLAGRDVIAQAATGSGKTLVFALSILAKIQTQTLRPQSLILCPTRELVSQVTKVLRQLASCFPDLKVLSIHGGDHKLVQQRAVEGQTHIVVATPGRLLSLLKTGLLKCHTLHTLVLDEADQMLSLGFKESIEDILQYLPSQRQTLLFSATFDDAYESLSCAVKADATQIQLEQQSNSPAVQQINFKVKASERLPALRYVLEQYHHDSSLIFCNTRKACHELFEHLHQDGHSVLMLHGGLEQQQRDQTLLRFANGSCSLLVTTDIAARGLDIQHLSLVINYELALQLDTHIHRIGRTGRGQQAGLAINLHTQEEQSQLSTLRDHFSTPIKQKSLPRLLQHSSAKLRPRMMTLAIAAGRKNKLRPGDILGALTRQVGIPGERIGKIDILDFQSFVAIQTPYADRALAGLVEGTIKGRKIKVKMLN